MLQEHSISSSAPCRVDCGGTWDIRAFSLPFWKYCPVTVNLAIDLRTHVRLHPHKDGWTRVTSVGFDPEEYPSEEAPFNTPLGLVFAIATYFNVTGVHIDISPESPPRSALGGSGVVGVALIHALATALEKLGDKAPTREETVQLAYRLEDGLSVSLTGMQDQAAATFGGINLWRWEKNGSFSRDALIPNKRIKEVDSHILIAFSGQAHNSVEINQKWITGFISGQHRRMWRQINENTLQFAEHLRQQEWQKAAEALLYETRLRRTLTTDVLIPITGSLIDATAGSGCGARFAGAGAGGCVWAIGDSAGIEALRERWRSILSKTDHGAVLDARVDPVGVVSE